MVFAQAHAKTPYFHDVSKPGRLKLDPSEAFRASFDTASKKERILGASLAQNGSILGSILEHNLAKNRFEKVCVFWT